MGATIKAFLIVCSVLQLHAVIKMPGFSIRQFVPEVVDGLFKMLEDTSPAVHDTTVTVLSELLHSLDPNEGADAVRKRFHIFLAVWMLFTDAAPSLTLFVTFCWFQASSNSIINILVIQSETSTAAREIALIWLNQLVVFYGALYTRQFGRHAACGAAVAAC